MNKISNLRVDLEGVIFGQVLKAGRLYRGLTQENFAELMDLSTPYVSFLECRKRRVCRRLMERSCRALNLDYNRLLDELSMADLSHFTADEDFIRKIVK